MLDYPFIGLAGNIGVGKTTFTEKIAAALNWTPIYESVSENPYLNDFYTDMNRWSFNLQIYFLQKRFEAQRDILSSKVGIVQDRTIYEDSEIFAKNLNQMGQLKDRDFKTYNDLFNIMTSYLRKPDLIIYLKASTDTLLTRIHLRGREYENKINPEYIHQLNITYDNWIKNIKDIKVITIKTDQFNIFNDHKKFNLILEDVQKFIESS
jgi:deoxyadenosine/deoxycytidine kinase